MADLKLGPPNVEDFQIRTRPKDPGSTWRPLDLNRIIEYQIN
jgi:hypothetical protein